MDISLKDLYETVHQKMKEGFDERLLGHIAVAVISSLNSTRFFVTP